MWKRPQDVERIGNYPFLNHIPGPTGGTFRQVWQRGDVPDPGAQQYAYSTFLIPTVDQFPYGGQAGLAPDPRSGGAMLMAPVQVGVTVTPEPAGIFERIALAFNPNKGA